MHLLDNTGNILPFEDFCSKFNLNDRGQYNNIIKVIPQSVIVMSYNLFQNNVTPNLPQLLVNGHNITNLKLPNFTIRQTFVKELYPFSSNRNSILQFFSKKEAENLRSKFFKFPVAPKAKEVHFKVLNGIYPSAEFLRRRFGLEIIIIVCSVMNTLKLQSIYFMNVILLMPFGMICIIGCFLNLSIFLI